MNQLRIIGQNLISEFGDAPRQELIVVDIDQSARPTYACKREGQQPEKPQKWDKTVFNGLLLFVLVKLLIKNLRRVIVTVLMILNNDINKLSKSWDTLIYRSIDGGYLSVSNLKLLENQLFCTKASTNLNCIKEGLKKAKGFYWKSIDKHTKIFDCGFMDIFPEVSQKYRLILVKGKKMKKRRIPKTQREKGRGYRSYSITYQEIIFGILTNLSGNKVLIYEFYKQRQTVENYFRDSNWSFETNKLPSQKFRAFLRLFIVIEYYSKCSSVV
ncbi:hypothetical protein BGP_2099 [Beggiatoa sp. PS]|nr:hypothetical protein BGP_2099 [Beggiatoa sp. PS]